MAELPCAGRLQPFDLYFPMFAVVLQIGVRLSWQMPGANFATWAPHHIGQFALVSTREQADSVDVLADFIRWARPGLLSIRAITETFADHKKQIQVRNAFLKN